MDGKLSGDLCTVNHLICNNPSLSNDVHPIPIAWCFRSCWHDLVCFFQFPGFPVTKTWNQYSSASQWDSLDRETTHHQAQHPMSRPVSAAGRTSSSPATWTSSVWRRYEKPTARWNPGMCWWPSMVDLQRTPKPGCKFPGGPIGPWEKMKQDETSWISWHGKNGIYLDNLDLSRGKWKFVLYIVLLIRSCLM